MPGAYRVMDMFLIKTMALIVARGSHSEKTEAFVDNLTASFDPKYKSKIYW